MKLLILESRTYLIPCIYQVCICKIQNVSLAGFNKSFVYERACSRFRFFRSSQRRYSIKNAALKNFAIFTGKHLCWSLFLTTLQVFRALRLPVLKNICERLLQHFLRLDFTEILSGNIKERKT